MQPALDRYCTLICFLITIYHQRALAQTQSPVQVATQDALIRRDRLQSQLPSEFVQLDALFNPRLRPLSFDEAAYDIGELALVSTVDGDLHAIRRETGQWAWTLHQAQNVQSQESSARIGQPLVSSSTVYSKTAFILRNESEPGPIIDDQEELYIVEPSAGGAVYLHRRTGDTIIKLPLTIAELVDLSPFTFPTDGSKMFVGKKTTELISIDLATGQLLGVFGAENGWCEWNQGINRRDPLQEWEEDIQSRQRDLLYLGRTEYQLSIVSQATGQLVQKLSYTSYHPSSLNSAAQQSSYLSTLDSRYFAPLQDGTLACFTDGQQGLQWATTPFKTPVVGMFDILYSVPSLHADARSSTAQQPILLRQPYLDDIGTSETQALLDNIPDVAYIGNASASNADESHFYLLSKRRFPLVSVVGKDAALEPTGPCEGRQCIVGIHRIDQSSTPFYKDRQESRPTLPLGQQRQPAIDAGPDGLPALDASPDQKSLPPGLDRPQLPGPRSTGLPLTESLLLRAILVAILALFIAWRHRARRKRILLQEAQTKPLEKFSALSQKKKVDEEEAIRNRQAILHAKTLSVDKDLPSLPSDASEESPQAEKENQLDANQLSDDESGEEANQHKRRARGKRKRGRRPGQKAQINGSADGPLADISNSRNTKAGSLTVSDTVLGYGSHGTVVLKGSFQNRAVAVKRMLNDFVTIATHEVNLLQESDEHENVIRYFCKEQKGNFLYIALELCPASLADLIEAPDLWPDLVAAFEPKRALRQIASGIAHLHRLKIIHRDIKPQNILVSLGKPQTVKGVKVASLRLLISDFGLCKKLGVDESSFLQTVNHAAGSFGYRAPEVLRGDVNVAESSLAPSTSSKASADDGLLRAEPSNTKRLTKSIDIFSLGCIFYYVLTSGEHPFGSRFEREINIIKDESSLGRLDGMDEELHEAQHMISSMIASEPLQRPAAETILLHPFFWNAAKRLNFLCEASDRFEIMERDPPNPVLVDLEAKSAQVLFNDWLKKLDRNLVDNLGKYRKYESNSVRDLLRVVRNKRHHFLDLPENVQRSVGSPPDEFLSYFTQRFPLLFLHVWDVVRSNLAQEAMFEATYFASER